MSVGRPVYDEEVRARLQREIDEMESEEGETEPPLEADLLDLQEFTLPFKEHLKQLREFDSEICKEFAEQLDEIRQTLHQAEPQSPVRVQRFEERLSEPQTTRPRIVTLLEQPAKAQQPRLPEQHQPSQQEWTPPTEPPEEAESEGQAYARLLVQARMERMQEERQELQMWWQDRHSSAVQAQAHMARFKNRLFRPQVRCPEESRVRVSLQWEPPAPRLSNLRLLPNKEDNRMPANSAVLALPALKRIAKMARPRRQQITLNLTFLPISKPSIAPSVKGKPASSAATASNAQSAGLCAQLKERLQAAEKVLASQSILVPFQNYNDSGFQQDFSLGGKKTVSEFVGQRVKQCQRWKHLDLRFEGITGFGKLPQLAQLTVLQLQHNNLVKQLEPFSSFPALLQLSLASNKITQLPAAGLPPTLRFLDISDNLFSELVLAPSAALVQICADRNSIERLTLKLGHLRRLSVSGNKLYEADLSGCLILEQVCLSKNKITQVRLPMLVRVLDLSSNSLFAFKAALPLLTRLSLANNQLSELELTEPRSLHTLLCQGNRLSDPGPVSPENLAILDFSANRLRSFSNLWRYLVRAASLEEMNYSANLLGGGGQKVLDFYQFLLLRKFTALRLLNMLECSGRGHLDARFGRLLRGGQGLQAGPQGVWALAFRLMSQESAALIANSREQLEQPFFMSVEHSKYKGQYCLNYIGAVESQAVPTLFATTSLPFLAATYSIRYEEALARVSRVIHLLRRRVACKRAYFSARRKQVLEGLVFMKRLRDQMGAGAALQQLKRGGRLTHSVVKIQRWYRGQLGRNKFRRLKAQYGKHEQQDQLEYMEQLQFFENKRQLKPIRLAMPAGMFCPQPLSNSVVREAERIVRKEASIDEYIKAHRTVLANNFLERGAEEESIVIQESAEESPGPVKKEKKERQEIWYKHEGIDELLIAKRRKVEKMQAALKKKRW